MMIMLVSLPVPVLEVTLATDVYVESDSDGARVMARSLVVMPWADPTQSMQMVQKQLQISHSLMANASTLYEA